MKYQICYECKQPIVQQKYALFNGKPCHIDFDQCFRALNKRIRELEVKNKTQLPVIPDMPEPPKYPGIS